MTPEQTAVVASAIAAAIGAVAAVVSAGFAGVAVWSQRQANKPHLRVSVTTALAAFGDEVSNALYVINVYNSGTVPVRLQGAGFEAKGGTIPYMGTGWGHPAPDGRTLPYTLEPGEELSLFWRDVRELARIHVGEQGPLCRGFVTTAGDHRFRSKAIKPAALATWARE